MASKPVTQDIQEKHIDAGEWEINSDQMLFMLQHNNDILLAFENDDMSYFKTLVSTVDYRKLFEDMSFDEAFDRYETMLEEDSDDS